MTIKGGVVMRSVTNNNRRATRDIDLDFIHYSIDAYDFAARYKGDVEGFLHFMCESEFSVNEENKDSWKYIETERHSLERHSNLCVCLREEKDRIVKQSMKTAEGNE